MFLLLGSGTYSASYEDIIFPAEPEGAAESHGRGGAGGGAYAGVEPGGLHAVGFADADGGPFKAEVITFPFRMTETTSPPYVDPRSSVSVVNRVNSP